MIEPDAGGSGAEEFEEYGFGDSVSGGVDVREAEAGLVPAARVAKIGARRPAPFVAQRQLRNKVVLYRKSLQNNRPRLLFFQRRGLFGGGIIQGATIR